MRRLVFFVVLASACSGAPEPTEAPVVLVPEPAPEPAASPDDLERAVEPTPVVPLVVGWPAVPGEPSPELRAELQAALALHRRGDFAGSEAAFRAVAERAPTYVNARYDHACALVRLGRLAEAQAILGELVTAALPAIGGRLETDEDLADLRAAASWSELSALRARAEAGVRAALDAGVVTLRLSPTLPADEDAEHRFRSVEIGVWLPEAARWVPLAPAHTIEVLSESPSLLAAAVDHARGAVLVAEGEGTWSEGDLRIPAVRVVAYRLGDGVELGRLDDRGTSWASPVEIHALADGIAIRYVADADVEPRPATRTVGTGPFDDALRPQIVFTRTNATVIHPAMPPPDGVGLARLAVTGLATPVTLARAHAMRAESYPSRGEWWAEDGDSLFVLTGVLSTADGSTSAAGAALSRVRRSSGEVELLASGSGAAQMLRGGDGALYAQVGDRVYRLGAAVEPLPDGLFLVPDDPAFYPYPGR